MDLRIDASRLGALLEETAAIGASADGGVRRLALSPADGAVRRRFAAHCEALGCEVEADRIGNLFARWGGREERLPPVVIGSHLDSQVAAGRFDGALGVLAGVEVLRTLAEQGVRLRRPLEVVSWTNEEGARFSPPMMGSGAFAGKHSVERMLAVEDEGGETVAAALAAIDGAGPARVGGRALDSYFELHIEQGPELEAAGAGIGVVTGGWPARALAVSFSGETAHAGPTPMPARRNALVAAARLIVAVEELAAAHAPEARTTATRIECWPNLPGIVPAEVRVLVDMRHREPGRLEAMATAACAAVEATAATTGVRGTAIDTYSFGGLEFDRDCVSLVERCASDRGYSRLRMESLAGHDANHLASVCPTAMIFCPCREGISHNPREWAEMEQILPSAEVLLHAVVARADR